VGCLSPLLNKSTEALPKTRSARTGFSGVKAHAGGGNVRAINSDIGVLLPIALSARNANILSKIVRDRHLVALFAFLVK
jgi:hypothetical protein